jgi:RNA-directed DNA polymerase
MYGGVGGEDECPPYPDCAEHVRQLEGESPFDNLIRDTFRRWNLTNRSDKAIEDLSRMFNPTIRGWLQYYGRYYRSALYPTMRELNRDLVLWAKRKYKKLRRHHRRAAAWIARISRRAPELFAHWQIRVRRGSMGGAV